MTPEYIMRASLCRGPSCASEEDWKQIAEMLIESLQCAAKYAEPGYSNPDKGILFCNWNAFPDILINILEAYGYATEWSDEWITCDGCGNALRTLPDCLGWTPSYTWENDCEIICKECQ